MEKLSYKAELVKAMDLLVRNANDENITMTWLSCGVPDDADNSDYEWFANNEEEFKELQKLFVKCISAKDYL